VKAAQEPRPANGFSATPSTLTATSVRAQAMRTTPSLVVVALVPAAVPILSASRPALSASGRGGGDQPPTARTPASRPMRANRRNRVDLDRLPSRTGRLGGGGRSPARAAGLPHRTGFTRRSP